MIEAFDVEWMALRRGYRRAMRVSVEPSEAAGCEAFFTGRGAAVVRTSWQPPDARPLQEIIYVARQRRDAEILRETEAPMLRDATPDQIHEGALQMGRLLGYPSCCAEAFAARLHRSRLSARDALRGLRERYHAASTARVERPRWELNNLFLYERLRLITFEPCRYDCELALRLATAIFRDIQALSAEDSAKLRRRLAVAVALDEEGRKAVVQVAGGVIVQAAAPLSHDDRILFPQDAAFARELPGAHVASGWLRPDAGTTTGMVLEFG